jgi:thymidylate synthase ThyX
VGYKCEVLADSVSEHGDRLTTFEVTYPRIVHSEVMTHRMLSRNAASSRAIPISISIRNVDEEPFVPEVFGSHQKGMVEGEPLSEADQNLARHLWLGARDAALDYARGLEGMKVYKGLVNRLLEPFSWITVILTATDWGNYLALRTAKDAQAEIRKVSTMMRDLYESSEPQELGEGEWHMPLVSPWEFHHSDDTERLENYGYWVPVSIGRCARVSYNRQHDGGDPDSDITRHDRLIEGTNRHLSPFEHVARPFSEDEWDFIREIQTAYPPKEYTESYRPFLQNVAHNLEYAGNLRGWWSARMDIPHESDYSKVLSST